MKFIFSFNTFPPYGRKKKIFGRCQKLFNTWEMEPTRVPRHPSINYALVKRSMSKSSFSESTSDTTSPLTVIMCYDYDDAHGCRRKDIKYAAVAERRARSRSAAPGVRYNKHRDYSWTAARNRTRSSSPHNRYHQSSN